MIDLKKLFSNNQIKDSPKKFRETWKIIKEVLIERMETYIQNRRKTKRGRPMTTSLNKFFDSLFTDINIKPC